MACLVCCRLDCSYQHPGTCKVLLVLMSVSKEGGKSKWQHSEGCNPFSNTDTSANVHKYNAKKKKPNNKEGDRNQWRKTLPSVNSTLRLEHAAKQ